MTTPTLLRKTISEAVARFEAGEIGHVELAEQILSGGRAAPGPSLKGDQPGQLGDTSNAAMGDAADSIVRIDRDRLRRCGAPEVVFAEGKTVDALIQAVDSLLQDLPRAGFRDVLVTRINVEQARHVADRFPHVAWDSRSRTMRIGVEESMPTADELAATKTPVVNVICAGTADLPVALEARETLAWMGISSRLLADVGVAGLHRLLGFLPELRGVAANIVVAGMEGALPSVVGGLVPCPVIAVPTSVGYGANFAGLSALLCMLNSCAANICVVNIDAGFKAAYVAGLMVSSRS